MTAWDGLEAAKAAVDQDRVAIDYFAKGGEEGVKANKVDILLDKEQTGATIVIRNEDHTLGNLLRHMIAQKPEVDFCGYSLPHPSEKAPINDIMTNGLQDIIDYTNHVSNLFQKAIGEYSA